MSTTTTRWGFTIPSVNERDPDAEALVNKVLRLVDLLAEAKITEHNATTPPGSPADEAIYALGSSPTGAWAGQGSKIAVWFDDDNAYTFLNMPAGFLFYSMSSSAWRRWDGSAFKNANI